MSTSVETWLSKTSGALAEAGIDTARLDCLILLEDALHQDRAYILAHPEAKVATKTEVELNKQIVQRQTHLPLAYIRNRAPFYGREFVVNRHVLVPRPESEAMIGILKALPLPARPCIADVGTGSGCLGITAALEIPGAKVDIFDINQQALAVALQNARIHGVLVSHYAGNLLEGHYSALYDVVLANLPYVPDGHGINQAARHEPPLALFGGNDGLKLYREFWLQVAGLTEKPAYILTESLPSQHHSLSKLAGAAGYRLAATEGYVQLCSVSS